MTNNNDSNPPVLMNDLVPSREYNRQAFRESVAATESARAVVITGVAMIVMSGLSALFIEVTAIGHVMHLLAACLVLLLAAYLRFFPPPAKHVPVAVASTAGLVVACLLVELWVDPDPLTAVYVLFAFLIYGPFVLNRKVMFVSALPFLLSYSIIVLLRMSPVDHESEGWVLAGLGAVVLSMILLHLRLVSIDKWADAMLKVKEMALYDALTQLLNRHGLEVALPLLVSFAKRNNEPIHIVFMDIRGLKKVNDNIGHSTGDRVIKSVANAISANCRGNDLPCRWGGDEYIVVGTGSAPDPDEYEKRVLSMLTDLGELDDVDWSKNVSAGVAELYPVLSYDTNVLDILCHEADQNMYQRRANKAKTIDIRSQ